MKKILDFIAKILEVLVIGFAFALIFTVLLQIFGRILGKPVSWTEELSRYLLAGVVAFSVPLAARRDQYIRVDVLLNRFPERIRSIWIMVLDAGVAVFLLIVAYHAISYIQVGALQKSSVLRIPMSYVNSTVLIGPALTAVFFGEKAVNVFLRLVRKEA